MLGALFSIVTLVLGKVTLLLFHVLLPVLFLTHVPDIIIIAECVITIIFRYDWLLLSPKLEIFRQFIPFMVIACLGYISVSIGFLAVRMQINGRIVAGLLMARYVESQNFHFAKYGCLLPFL